MIGTIIVNALTVLPAFRNGAFKNKKAEAEKAESMFFEMSSELCCIAGFDGYFKKVNAALVKVLGYSEEELLKICFLDLVLDADKAKSVKEISSFLYEGRQGEVLVNRFRCKDGSIKYISWNFTTVSKDKIFYANGRDVTNEIEEKQLLQQRSGKTSEKLLTRTESLQYARLLQEAIMHDPDSFSQYFPDSFIYHAPKDILSGDFYWFDKVGDRIIAACVDCTGHGVPGAMLSVLGINKLYEAIRESETFAASELLDNLNSKIYSALGKKHGPRTMIDGMDMALFIYNSKTNELQFAGANNPLLIIRNGKLITLQPDKKSIGSSIGDGLFTNHTFQLERGDMLYVFSDGYASQFGGPNGKKFTTRQFRELVLSIAETACGDQKAALNKRFHEWMGSYEQIDDVCVMGVRI